MSRSIPFATSPTARPAARATRSPTAAAALGARVTLVSGPVGLPDPDGVQVVRVETAAEMLAAVETALPADVARVRRCRRRLARRRCCPREDQERQGRSTQPVADREPRHPQSCRSTHDGPARHSSSALQPRPRTSSSTRAPSASRKAATGSSPTTSAPKPASWAARAIPCTSSPPTASRAGRRWARIAVAERLVARIAEHLTLGQADV